MSEKLFEAVEFATKAHSGQFRKGTAIPYIVHPIEVMEILSRIGRPEVEVIAGVLHDTTEDTAVTSVEIKQKFGPEVQRLVEGASEPDKSLSWEERKEHTINRLATQDMDILNVVAADKLSNLRSFSRGVEGKFDIDWGKFNRGEDQQRWYYKSIVNQLMSRDGSSYLFLEVWAETQKVFL